MYSPSSLTIDLPFECAVNDNEIIYISSSTNCSGAERASSEKSFNATQESISQFNFYASSSETTSTFMNDSCQLRMRVHSSTSSSSSGILRRSSGGIPVDNNGLRTEFGLPDRTNCTTNTKYELLESNQDPFAFDEDEFQPSKWDLLSGKRKKSQSRNRSVNVVSKELEDECQYQLMGQEELINGENHKQKSRHVENNPSQENSHRNAAEEEHSSLLADCLLTAVKVCF